jgi:predicted MPP superfamily phosphohydrolase
MRKRDIVIFFSLVLTLYGLFNLYIFTRGWQALPEGSALRTWYTSLFLILSLSFIVGRFIERIRITPLSSALIWLGSFWLAAMVYFLLIVVAIDVLRLLDSMFPFIPQSFFMPKSKFNVVMVSIIMVASIVVAGAINAGAPRIKTLNLTIPKNSHLLKSLNIVAASDIHLGTIICKARLERIVEKINSLNADVVLLPGDVVDEDIGPVIKQNLGETLRKIRSKYGVIAITGNHEYIGGVEAACKYLVEHGITMLRDSVVKVADTVYVVGREDVSYNRGAQRRRKSLPELIHGINKTLPIILMDHQPFRLHEAEENGVDLQLSGHTHDGQLWPFNYLTRRIFEVSWGYKKKGNTHIYVSCGVGSWGPPVRVGNTPEIMNIKLTFA